MLFALSLLKLFTEIANEVQRRIYKNKKNSIRDRFHGSDILIVKQRTKILHKQKNLNFTRQIRFKFNKRIKKIAYLMWRLCGWCRSSFYCDVGLRSRRCVRIRVGLILGRYCWWCRPIDFDHGVETLRSHLIICHKIHFIWLVTQRSGIIYCDEMRPSPSDNWMVGRRELIVLRFSSTDYRMVVRSTSPSPSTSSSL